MRKIDIHTHILPEKLPNFVEKFGYKGFLHLHHHKPTKALMIKDDKVFREIEHNCWDPLVRLQECDEQGVDVQVLSTIPVLFNYWAVPEDALEVCRFINDHIAQLCADHPNRFVGLGTLPLQSTELSLLELDRCMNELGLAGVEIGSHVNEWNLDDPHLFPVLEAAQDLDASVFVHPWDMRGAKTIQKYWLPWLMAMPFETGVAISSLIFGGVLERLPKLKIAFAHGGGSFPCLVGRVEHGFRVRPDLCKLHPIENPRDYLGRFYVDSLVHDEDAMNLILKVFGEDKVLLGSDYPFPLGEHMPGSLIESMGHLNDKLKQNLLADNALEWLGMTKEQLFSVN